MAKVEVGDWVAQYCPEIWQAVEIHPDYAAFSCGLSPVPKRPAQVSLTGPKDKIDNLNRDNILCTAYDTADNY